MRWSAPGRANLIGEHTDYNAGLALPFAIDRRCVADVRRVEGPGWTVRSAQIGAPVQLVDVDDPGTVPGWARYALGAVALLRRDGVDVPPLDLRLDSTVPLGAGLSSSAAVVCAAATAVDDLLGLDLDADALLDLTRRVENDYVGAPTGGLDQLASLRGLAGHVLLCDFRAMTAEPVPFDPGAHGLSVLAVDTRVEHRHADGEYAARRAGCTRAAAALGCASLREVETDRLEDALRRLPDGELRRLVRHVVTENDRVRAVAALLRADRLAEIGPFLTASHASLRDDYRVTVPALDVAADGLLDAGALGARMTGGGFGGCVIALLPSGAVPAAESAVRTAYERRGWTPPACFTISPAQGARREPVPAERDLSVGAR